MPRLTQNATYVLYAMTAEKQRRFRLYRNCQNWL